MTLPLCHAGSHRQRALTAEAFITALGREHTQLALARFQQMDNKPFDLETAVTSIYASASESMDMWSWMQAVWLMSSASVL